ncbi:restriction endonuclease subunit S [Xenorhabdus szentirmaii]|uniref:restriction endonuclease subunit S n=1 Tax=Xenorhabdus szentirmaii TaxID=290112 RepID=UPI0019BD3DAD|nr:MULTISPECIES: restriction endonuclease subunit S [unclassified Xenorhabdus]MBD2791406.1 restriction endonuclease subunit S [Xenorhabdus sp. CUL]
MVPKLRLGLYKNEELSVWHKAYLGELVEFKKGRGISKSDISENGQYPCIRYGELYTIYNEKIYNIQSRTNCHPDEYVISKTGDVLIPASGETAIDIARASTLLEDNVILGGDINILTPKVKNISSLFLSYNIVGKKRNELAKMAQGNSVVHLYSSQLKTLEINFPSLEEQKKIANFLSSVDEKFTLLNKQYDLLCQYKKGIMQKIFSQELRFKDENGEDFPDWEKCELKNFLIPTLREVKKPIENFLSIGVRSHFKGTFHKEEQDPNKVSVDKLFLVHKGDFILNITFAWEGALAIVRKEDHLGYVSHRFPTYTFKKEVITSNFFRYIYTLPKFLTYLDLCSPGGAGRNRVLKKSEFLEIKIDRPCMAEQTKIASFLSAIEDKITTKKEELDTLKTWKQGLLQQMFV